jgi:hypothetical protein
MSICVNKHCKQGNLCVYCERDRYRKALAEIINHYGVTPYEEGVSPLSIATEAIKEGKL